MEVKQSAIRVFALVVGIDKYKSGAVWNLESCVDDAQKVQRWLRKDLKVPKDQICMLLDKHATKENIEKGFLHLMKNEKIKRGDAILVYFAGHGSTVPAPDGWFHKGSVGGRAEVLCSYDFGQRGVAGISDRSLQSMLDELSQAKGDNIAVILDSCFAPLQSPANVRVRRNTRWMPSDKIVTSQDLFNGLWPAATTQVYPRSVGFCNTTNSSAYTLLAACSPGEKAIEGKDGGKFTSSFLETARETPLHSESYVSLLKHIQHKVGGQRPMCVGANVKRPVFDAVPFLPDKAYFQTDPVHDSKMLRIGLGAVHGVVEGTEFSVHGHNYCGSSNPAIAHVAVTDVYPTWSFGYTSHSIPCGCWAQIKRWNNRTGFRGPQTKRSFSLLRSTSGASFRSVGRSLFLRSR